MKTNVDSDFFDYFFRLFCGNDFLISKLASLRYHYESLFNKKMMMISVDECLTRYI